MDQHIVIVDSGQLDDCISKVKESIIVCLDPPRRIPDTRINDLVIIDDPLSRELAYNYITGILELYNEWFNDMTQIQYVGQNFHSMVNKISEIAEHPVALADDSLKYIAVSSCDDNFPESQEYNLLKYFDEELSGIGEEYERLIQNRHDAFTRNSEEASVIKNIFSNGMYVGRLIIVQDKDSDAIEYYKAVLDCAAPFVEALYNQFDSFENTSIEYQKVHQYMVQIMSVEPINQVAFAKLLRDSGVLERDQWYVLSAAPKDASRPMYNTKYICSQIERRFPGSFCVSRQGLIVGIVDVDYYKRSRRGEVLQDLEEFVCEMALKAGLSRRFRNISLPDNVSKAFSQARYALNHGRKVSSSQDFFFFDDFALDFILTYGAGALNLQQICHPAILTLKNHDRRSKTSLTETLNEYVRQRYNAVAAAKALCIHRSSFINRMNRIQSLTNLNLDDSDELLYLEISFRLFGETPKK